MAKTTKTMKTTKAAKPAKTKASKAKTAKATPKPKAKSIKRISRRPAPPLAIGASSAVLDRLWDVIDTRRTADPALSHSARLLARGTTKIAQKFGEEAVECLIEAVSGQADALVAESADVLYHLLVMWVDAGIRPGQVWNELQRREGISGIAEKASRVRKLSMAAGLRTSKIS